MLCHTPRRNGKTLMTMKNIELRIEQMRRIAEQGWREIMGSYTSDLYCKRGSIERVSHAVEELFERLSAEKGRKGTSFMQGRLAKKFDIEINRDAIDHSRNSIRGIHADKIYWFEEEN